jgi:hypothetical protein
LLLEGWVEVAVTSAELGAGMLLRPLGAGLDGPAVDALGAGTESPPTDSALFEALVRALVGVGVFGTLVEARVLGLKLAPLPQATTDVASIMATAAARTAGIRRGQCRSSAPWIPLRIKFIDLTT